MSAYCMGNLNAEKAPIWHSRIVHWLEPLAHAWKPRVRVPVTLSAYFEYEVFT